MKPLKGESFLALLVMIISSFSENDITIALEKLCEKPENATQEEIILMTEYIGKIHNFISVIIDDDFDLMPSVLRKTSVSLIRLFALKSACSYVDFYDFAIEFIKKDKIVLINIGLATSVKELQELLIDG